MQNSEASVRVEAIIEPYDRGQNYYQLYYRDSIVESCRLRGVGYQEQGQLIRALRLLCRLRHSSQLARLIPQRLSTPILDGVARRFGADPSATYTSGRYLFNLDGAEVKVCLDAHDSGVIERPDFLTWCDLYFKTNYWPDVTYPEKVIPLPNLNPLVAPRIDQLKGYRASEKQWDLFAFFRVWGGADEVQGIEHNLALFEALARVNCRKYLLAYLVAGDIKAAAARLERAGVPWTTKWVPRDEVWQLAANSRLNIVRHGMHECIPWRMTEILAMGGCPVLDYAARTRWHLPLEENVHYLNLGADFVPHGSSRIDAKTLVKRVEGWLEHPSLVQSVATNAARYFDENLALEKLGNHILDTVAQGSSRH